MLYLLALLIGIVAGLRAMTAPAAISWAAYLGLLDLSGSWLSFLASPWAVGILSVLALVEFVTDQLPSTPSRKVRCTQPLAQILSLSLKRTCSLSLGQSLVSSLTPRRLV